MASRVFPTRYFQKYAIWFVVAGLVIAAAVGLAEYHQALGAPEADNFVLDRLLVATASGHEATHTLVIDVDEKSLAALGQWPWPRYQVANLLQAIAKAKPRAIGLDLMFPEADRTSLSNIQQAFKRDFGLEIAFTGVPQGLSDNDGYLGHTIGQTKAVAARYFFFDQITRSEMSEAPHPNFEGPFNTLALNVATGVLANTPRIASQTAFSGFINSQPDADGRLRRLALLLNYRGAVFPSLALATSMQSMGVSLGQLQSDRDGPVIRVGEHRIPIDAHGDAILRFNGAPSLYPSVSAVDILDGRIDASQIAGRTVFVGSSAAALSDLHNTAFDPYFPGLKIQAVLAEAIATDQFVRAPTWAPVALLGQCLVIGLLMALLFASVENAIATVAASALVLILPLVLTVALFRVDATFLSPAAPALLAVVLFGVFSVARLAIEQRLVFVNMKKLENAHQVTIESMAAVAETRDPETGAHIKRTQHYVRAIAERLRALRQYPDVLTVEYIDLLYISAPLHDIGKVGVPDHILLKPGKLTDDELVVMKRHAEFGRTIISSTSRLIEGDNYLIVAGEIAATHHEKWDGSGYPMGLSGENIPLSGRIMAVADIYDALISRRCYKEPFPHAAAKSYMQDMRGTTFDPNVLDAFFSIESTILEIARRYADPTESQGLPNHGERELDELAFEGESSV